jgi:hypothetical protein
MERFEDERTKCIYETRFATDVPEHVSVGAHKIMGPLVAAQSLQDVGVLGQIIRWPSAPPDRFGLHVDGKWHVTFTWIESIGAYQLLLERC